MSTPITFDQLILSASALTQLDRCPRLFRYLYVDQLIWPGAAVFDTEAEAEQGRIFHRLIDLQTKGHSIDPLLATRDPQLQTWWQTFCESEHHHPQGEVLSELPLWIHLEGIRIVARFDRLVIQTDTDPPEFQIVDWKTQQTRPADRTLDRSWQVRLYPLLLCLAGERLNHHHPIQSSTVEMTLWFAHHPDQPYRRRYSLRQQQQDRQDLGRALKKLRSLSEQNFPMTQHTEICKSCLFRTRCYGITPEMIDQIETESLSLVTSSLRSP